MTCGRIRAGLDEVPGHVDVLVIGLGVTGTGVALDAVARGLTVLPSTPTTWRSGRRDGPATRHGGLRYLANGQVGVAHESAVERGILMEVTAPHLTHALPFLLPLDDRTGTGRPPFLRAGVEAGDWLRIAARTSRRDPAAAAPGLGHREPTPRARARSRGPRRVPVLGRPARGRRPPGRHDRLHGRRLGAELRTRARAVEVTGTGATLRDELSGTTYDVSAARSSTPPGSGREAWWRTST
jgi:glycerol-3-phosphate dehydrogenase